MAGQKLIVALALFASTVSATPFLDAFRVENGQCLGSDGASCALVPQRGEGAPDEESIFRNPLTSADIVFSLESCAESCARSTSCNGFELSGCENKCTFVTCGDSITGNSTAERDTSTQCYKQCQDDQSYLFKRKADSNGRESTAW